MISWDRISSNLFFTDFLQRTDRGLELSSLLEFEFFCMIFHLFSESLDDFERFSAEKVLEISYIFSMSRDLLRIEEARSRTDPDMIVEARRSPTRA